MGPAIMAGFFLPEQLSSAPGRHEDDEQHQNHVDERVTMLKRRLRKIIEIKSATQPQVRSSLGEPLLLRTPRRIGSDIDFPGYSRSFGFFKVLGIPLQLGINSKLK